MAENNHASSSKRGTRLRRFLTHFGRPAYVSPSTPTTDLTSNGFGAFCPVCRNLDIQCSRTEKNGQVFVEVEGPPLTFSRDFCQFDTSADQGCSLCWVLASVGRLLNDRTRLYVCLDYGRDPLVRGTKSDKSMMIYIPNGDSSSESPYIHRHLSHPLVRYADISKCCQTFRVKIHCYLDPSK